MLEGEVGDCAFPCDGLPLMPPNPGIDDHLFRRFCALVGSTGEVGEDVEVGEETPLPDPDATAVVMWLLVLVRLVLAEEPVVLGEL